MERSSAKTFNLVHFGSWYKPVNKAEERSMSSTSQKHRDFVSEPMGDKPVTALAGIGDALGGRLASKGFDMAYVVLGQFLVLKRNEELFCVCLHSPFADNSLISYYSPLLGLAQSSMWRQLKATEGLLWLSKRLV